MDTHTPLVSAMPIIRWFFPLLLLTSGAQSVLAHPGHGSTDPSEISHVAEPSHLLPVLVSLAAISMIGVISLRRYQQAHARKPKP